MTTAETHSGREASDRAPGWIGSLADTPLAEVFQRIVHEGRSGDLQVTMPEAIKTVYFDRGFVVLASSNLKNDRLGESMIEAGRISRHEFALVSMVMKASNRKFGETLVQAGIVSEEELGHYVATQVNRIVLSLFSAKTGMYSFDERACTIPVELMVSLSVYRILLEGVRRMARKKLVLAGLPPLDTKLRVAAEPPFSLDLEQLRPVEKEVLRAAGTGTSIAEIVKALGGEEGVALRAAYGLCSAGVLEAIAPEVQSRRLRVQEETGTFVLSEIRRKVEAKRQASQPVVEPPNLEEPLAELVLDQAPLPSPPQPGEPEARPSPARAPIPSRVEARERPPSFLSRVFQWVKGQGVFKTLAAALWPLWDRFERAMLRWVGSSAAEVDPETLVSPPPKPRTETRPSPAPVPDEPTPDSVGVPSWSILSTPEERTEPTPSVHRKTPRMENVGVPSWSVKDAPDEVESSLPHVPSWSMKDDPKELVLEAESSPPWSIEDPLGGSEELTPLSSLDNELFIEGELLGDDAPSMLSHIPVEEIEVELQIEVEEEAFSEVPEAVEASPEVTEDQPPAPAPRSASEAPLESPLASRPEETPSESRAELMRRVKQGGGESRLLRDVKLHFKMQDWEGAVPLLEQLVQISPGSALYRGMLARAMSRDPMMRKDAEEHFIEALRLAPQDAELHYWLGLYYKSFGLKSRADTEFKTTLRIDPRHQGARQQLMGGPKDDALGTVLKKIFG